MKLAARTDQGKTMAKDEAGGGLRLGDFLPYRLSVLSNTVSRRIAERYEAEFGLSIREWRVMAVLGEEAGLAAGDVAGRTAMDKVAVSRAVARLLEKGHAERTPEPGDGRSFRLALTGEGRRVYREVARIAIDYERALLDALGAEDRGALETAMDRLAEAVSPDRSLW